VEELLDLCDPRRSPVGGPSQGAAREQAAALAQLSLVAVFKDVVPAYRIRPPTEEELAVKVSKDVLKLRQYEQGLLQCYQSFLKLLLAETQRAESRERERVAAGAQSSRPPAAGASCVALSCLGALLGALPHFNFRKDLLTAVVPRVGSRDWAAGRACFDAVRDVLANDPEGEATVEAVQLLADHIKRRRCVVHPRVVALLLYVEVDTSLGSVEGAGKGRDAHGHRAKKLSRKAQKKANLKAGKDLGFEAAKAKADRSNRVRRQSQLLEAVFESLFRILKRYVGMPSTLGEERTPPAAAAADGQKGRGSKRRGGDAEAAPRGAQAWDALDPCLEGLAKLAQQLNVEYLPDLFATFRALLLRRDLPPKERLRCIRTMQAIREGPGQALSVDSSQFFRQLFAAVKAAPYAAPGDWSPRDDARTRAGAGAGAGAPRGLASARDQMEWAMRAPFTQEALALEAVERALVRGRSMDQARVAAFAKAAAFMGLQQSSGGALGGLALALRLLRKYPRVRSLLDSDGVAGAQLYDVGADEPEQAGALNTVLWELALLGDHFHPAVAANACGLAAMAESGAVADLDIRRAGPAEIAEEFSVALGGFRPPPQEAPGRRGRAPPAGAAGAGAPRPKKARR